MKRNLLLTPGPSKVPVELCEVLGKSLIHHRTPQFQQELKEVTAGLKEIMNTKNDVYLLASSGTGAMEAAVANILSPGEKAITVESGKFGERWTELVQAYNCEAVVVEKQWGFAITAEDIKIALDAHPDAKAVFVTHSETSTAVAPDLKAIGALVRGTDKVLVVDAVSALGTEPMKMDEWAVDVLCSGSHKGLMLPPGVGIISVSDKAYAMMETSTNTRYYFDLRKAKKAAAATDTPFTPAISIVIALNAAVKMLLENGLEEKQAYYQKMAEGLRAAVVALGLSVFTDASSRTRGLTAICIPEGLGAGKIVKTMRDVHGITIAGGQGHIKDKVIRIAHMGAVDEYDVLTGIGCLEKVLKEVGHKFEMGAGVAAAQKVFNA